MCNFAVTAFLTNYTKYTIVIIQKYFQVNKIGQRILSKEFVKIADNQHHLRCPSLEPAQFFLTKIIFFHLV